MDAIGEVGRDVMEHAATNPSDAVLIGILEVRRYAQGVLRDLVPRIGLIMAATRWLASPRFSEP